MKRKILSMVLVVTMCVSVFVGCGKDKKPTSDEIQKGTTDLQVDLAEDKDDVRLPSGTDFETDVKAETLWVNEDGTVVDANGDPVDAYRHIYRIKDTNALSYNGENVMEGYAVDEDNKIVFDIPYPVEDSESSTELDEGGELTLGNWGYGFFLQDVEDGKLYAKDHKVVDVNGNPISEWEFIIINGNNQIVIEGHAMESFTVADDGKIVKKDEEDEIDWYAEIEKAADRLNDPSSYTEVEFEEYYDNYLDMTKLVIITGEVSEVVSDDEITLINPEPVRDDYYTRDFSVFLDETEKPVSTPKVGEVVTIRGVRRDGPGFFFIVAKEMISVR